MNDLLIAAIYGLAAVLPVGLNWYANSQVRDRYMDALGLSVMLVIFWGVSNILVALGTPPQNRALYPVIDFVGLCFAANAAVRRFRRWKVLLSLTFLLQLATHAAFWPAYIYSQGTLSHYNYDLVLNVLFLAQVACVAWPGGSYVVRHVIAWLPLRRGLRGPEGLGPV